MKKMFFSLLVCTSIGSFCQTKSFKVDVYGKGQPIILIPGYACSGDVWKTTVDNLETKYQLHVLTIAGFAGVPPVDTPILKTVKNDLIKYVQENHLSKPVLIGHGMGAFICLWVASERPDLFSKIICADGVPFYSAIEMSSLTEAQAKSYFYHGAESVVNKLKNTPDNVFAHTQFSSTLNMVSDSAQAGLITKWALTSDRKALGYTYIEMNTKDLRKEISKINLPVLILASIYGRNETQKIFSEQYSLLPNKKIITVPTKHFIMYDDPLWFREQVKNFLRNGLAD